MNVQNFRYMYHVPSAAILAVGTRFFSTTNQYFLTKFFLVESNWIHFSQCTFECERSQESQFRVYETWSSTNFENHPLCVWLVWPAGRQKIQQARPSGSLAIPRIIPGWDEECGRPSFALRESSSSKQQKEPRESVAAVADEPPATLSFLRGLSRTRMLEKTWHLSPMCALYPLSLSLSLSISGSPLLRAPPESTLAKLSRLSSRFLDARVTGCVTFCTLSVALQRTPTCV